MDLGQHHPKTIYLHRVLRWRCGQNPRGFKRILTTITRKTFIAFRGGGGRNTYSFFVIPTTTSTKAHAFMRFCGGCGQHFYDFTRMQTTIKRNPNELVGCCGPSPNECNESQTTIATEVLEFTSFSFCWWGSTSPPIHKH